MEKNSTIKPKDIREVYKHSSYTQNMVLKNLRVHYGLQTTRPKSVSKVEAQSSRRETTNTSGFDALITLTRQLLSLNLEVDVKSPAEEKLLQVCWSDLGWDAEEDGILKTSLINAVLGSDNFTNQMLDRGKSAIGALLKNENIANVISHNPSFDIFAPYILRRPIGSEESWEISTLDIAKRYQFRNQAEPWDGSNPLCDYLVKIIGKFDDETHHNIALMGTPMFLQVQFQPSIELPDIFASLRTVRLKGETIMTQNGKPVELQRNSLYVLCATILHNGEHVRDLDDIRLYWNNVTEICPPVIEGANNLLLDYPRRQQKTKLWSLSQPGRYSLYYCRLESNDDQFLRLSDGKYARLEEFGIRNWEIPRGVSPNASPGSKERNYHNGQEKLQKEALLSQKKSQGTSGVNPESQPPANSKPTGHSNKRPGKSGLDLLNSRRVESGRQYSEDYEKLKRPISSYASEENPSGKGKGLERDTRPYSKDKSTYKEDPYKQRGRDNPQWSKRDKSPSFDGRYSRQQDRDSGRDRERDRRADSRGHDKPSNYRKRGYHGNQYDNSKDRDHSTYKYDER